MPLFIEEVTRLLIERGEAGGLQAIPPTLQQSLAARLDRLGEAREVAQIGAVLGRDFTYALLSAVGGIDDPALQSALDRLTLFLLAAEAMSVAPAQCLVVEDVPAGILAARNAGMAALGVARLGDEALLRDAGADLVVISLGRVDMVALVRGTLSLLPLPEASPDA